MNLSKKVCWDCETDKPVFKIGKKNLKGGAVNQITRNLARKGTQESHICTVSRAAGPCVSWHWQCVPMCDPGEVSQLLAREPQSLIYPSHFMGLLW